MSDVPIWLLTGLVDVAKEHRPEVRVEEMLARFEVPAGRYVSYGTFSAVLEELQLRLGGPEEMVEIGRISIRQLKGNSFQRVARQIVSLEALYRMSGWHGRFALPFLYQRMQRRADGRLTIDFHFKEHAPLSVAFCMGTQGTMEAMPLLIGEKELRAHATIEGQRFRLFLSVPRTSLLQRGTDRLRTLVAAPLALREISVQADDWRERYEELSQTNRLMREESGRRVEAEDERTKMAERLVQQQKMEAVGTLASGIAHDFNNILTIMMLNIDRARRRSGGLDGELVEIERATQRATRLTQQLLAFSRQERVQPRLVSAKHLVAQMEELVTRLLPDTVELRLDLSDQECSVRIDPGQLEQTLVNLLINARDAMEGGGTITISAAEVGERVEIAVTDDGAGIDPEIRHRLFDPFFTTKARGKGTGLGLALAHATVTQAGGTIEVDSAPGEGSCFLLSLPRASSCGEVVAVGSDDELAVGTERILIVDDDVDLGRGVAELLGELGYVVEFAETGARALELIANSSWDLVVVDVMMPGMDGVTLVKRLRATCRSLSVLYITGQVDADDFGVAVPAEAEVLHKPFAPADVARRVRSLLDGRTNS